MSQVKSISAKTESVENLQPEIDKMIDGAKKALAYFEWIMQAHRATEEIIKSQVEYAKTELQKLEDEKARKFESLDVQSSN